MSKTSKQIEVRTNFIEECLFTNILISDYANHELLIKTENQLFPYICLSIAPLTESQAIDKINYIKTKNNYHKAREKALDKPLNK